MSYGFQRAAPHQANFRQTFRQFRAGGSTQDHIEFAIPRDMPRRFVWFSAVPIITQVNPALPDGQYRAKGLLRFFFGGSLVFDLELWFGRNTACFTPEPDYFVTIDARNDDDRVQAGKAGQPALVVYANAGPFYGIGANQIPPLALMLSADAVMADFTDMDADATAIGVTYGLAVLSQTESL